MAADRRSLRRSLAAVVAVALVAPARALVCGASRGPRLATRVSATHRIDTVEVGGPLEPLSNYLFVSVDATSETSAGGVVLSGNSREPAKTGTVVAAGPGRAHPESGAALPLECAPGERVMWGRYAGANVKYDGGDHTLLKDRDVSMVWEGALTSATARPIGANVLIRVAGTKGQTASGLLLGLAAQDKISLEGEIVAAGPGPALRDGSRGAMPVAPGDTVRFRDMDVAEIDIDGEEYVLLKAEHVMLKWQAA